MSTRIGVKSCHRDRAFIPILGGAKNYLARGQTHRGKGMKAAFFCDPLSWVPGNGINFVFGKGRSEQIAALAQLHPGIVTSENFDAQFPALAEVEVIFSTWGMPKLTASQIERMPKLRAVLYAAGSIKEFARPFLETGITVSSAATINAIPVAEFTLGQILLAMKGYFRNSRENRSPDYSRCGFKGPGNFGDAVALIGIGAIGRKVLELLAPFKIRKLAVCKYLSSKEADELGAQKVTLEEAFAQAFVISNHLADVPDTKKVINAPLLRSMRPGATFINTGRGAQVDENALVEVLLERPDLTALLDVTDPEPPVVGSPLFSLPNVSLTTHIAGGCNDEVVRMADAMIAEYEALRDGHPLQFSASLQDLDTCA